MKTGKEEKAEKQSKNYRVPDREKEEREEKWRDNKGTEHVTIRPTDCLDKQIYDGCNDPMLLHFTFDIYPVTSQRSCVVTVFRQHPGMYCTFSFPADPLDFKALKYDGVVSGSQTVSQIRQQTPGFCPPLD